MTVAVPVSATARVTARTRARLTSMRPSDELTGWILSVGVFLVAFLLRVWRVGYPNKIIFDETYYAKDAWSLLHHGFEADASGHAAFVVHPPVGKWMIAIGEAIFGNTPVGWRASSAVVGALCVLLLTRTVRRITGSTFLGCVAGMLLALDGLAFVLSRTALLDGFLLFWVLVALHCMVLDRDHGRARLLARIEAAETKERFGPTLGIRWWRIATLVALGLACATKWSGLYYLLFFGVLMAVWDVGARRSAGIKQPVVSAVRRDWLPLIPLGFLVPLATYLFAWTGWFSTDGGWDRHWKGQHGVIGTLKGFWHYQWEVYNFHHHLSTPHSYASKPFTWLVIGRPVSFSVDYPKNGEHLFGETCRTAAEKCYSEVLAVGTPAIWWVAIPCIFITAFLWISKRDWRAALALVGFAAGFLPWLPFSTRTMFYFYALPFFPFEILAIVLVIGMVLGRDPTPEGGVQSEARRLVGAVAVGLYLLLVVINFVWLHPVLTGDLISPSGWTARVSDWFPGWI